MPRRPPGQAAVCGHTACAVRRCISASVACHAVRRRQRPQPVAANKVAALSVVASLERYATLRVGRLWPGTRVPTTGGRRRPLSIRIGLGPPPRPTTTLRDTAVFFDARIQRDMGKEPRVAVSFRGIWHGPTVGSKMPDASESYPKKRFRSGRRNRQAIGQTLSSVAILAQDGVLLSTPSEAFARWRRKVPSNVFCVAARLGICALRSAPGASVLFA